LIPTRAPLVTTAGDRLAVTVARERWPVALYVHFPFCVSICPYCDFVVYAGRAARGPVSRIATFVDALVAEIGLRATPGAQLGSVYLGGGTPSLMSAAQVERILTAAEAAFAIAPGAEITVEANPGPDERGDLAGFRAAGVNRLSIGAQSFSDGELRRLGRRHSADDVAATVSAARSAGLENISLDLLYDVPGQTADSWRATLTAALRLQPDHISAYVLSLDDPDADGLTGRTGDHLPLRPGARRWRDRARLEQDDEGAARMYEIADEALSAAGLDWYELSNWTRPGAQSRHNLAYWHGAAWEAVGPGAHAFDGARTRRWNAARLDSYLAALVPTDGRPAELPPGGQETTDETAADAERAILRLRTQAGLPPRMAARFAGPLGWAAANGLTESDSAGSVWLTRRGRLLANELFVRLLPESTRAAA
jgi:putative oxygen-independent coproporphyrinogen III oxidase